MSWLERLLAPFASERNRSGWRGGALLILLVLAPVAYLAAILLGGRLETGGVKFLPPGQAAERARQVARQMRVDVTGWREVLAADFNKDLYSYFDDPRFRNLPAEQKRFTPFASTKITFLNGMHWVQVRLRPDGSLLGVRLSPSLAPSPRRITEEEARELATAELERLLHPPASLDLRNAELLPGDAAETRRFRWEATFSALSEMHGAFIVDVIGDRVLAAREDFTIEPAAVAARADAWGRSFASLRSLLVLLLACYGLYRFAIRSMEKEVALARCGILFGMMFSLVLVLVVVHPGRFVGGLEPDRLNGGLFTVTLLNAVVSSVISGVLLALSYGGSEGELREIYPGKLTSLDALLTGRWFSANVGAAIVLGIAAAGWGLLLNAAGEQIFLSQMPRFLPDEAMLSYVHNGWMALLLDQPASAFFICTYGLLLPLMLANRHVPRRNVRRWVIVALGLLGATVATQDINFQMPWMLLRVLTLGALMLISFWFFDFLSAVIAVNLFVVGHAVSLLAPLGGEWPVVLRFVVIFTLVTVAFGVVAAYRARSLAEETVRPKYAERLLERLSLQAEVGAAREAQLRLSPMAIPQVPGLSVAASCTPANEVGGDFYDFFLLARGGLGVLVAEGGSTGLASALTIGLAKGFLLYATERGWSPGEALRHLRPVLIRAVKGTIDRLGLAYVEIGATGHVRIARFGAYPKLVELAPGRAPREIELLGLAEEDFVGERALELGAGSTLLLVTDGLVDRIRRRSGQELLEWLDQRKPGAGAGLHGLLMQDAAAGEAVLDDDLTLVVVERMPRAVLRQESVA